MAEERQNDDAPLNDNEQLKKDRAYAPSSGRETEERQKNPSDTHSDVDTDAVGTLPGTGGPDDYGDVSVDEADLNVPRRTDAR